MSTHASAAIFTPPPPTPRALSAASSAEGTPTSSDAHIARALTHARLFSSDPLCADHRPEPDGTSLHGAACHACLFAPETSCERGNRYLDRSTLVQTLGSAVHPFFGYEV